MRKLIKIIAIAAIGLITAIPNFAQDSILSLSLSQTCKRGIEQNVLVRNAGLEWQKSKYQASGTKSKLYPQLEAYSNFSYYFAIPRMAIPGEIIGQPGTTISAEVGTKFDWSNGFKATQLIYNQSYSTYIKLAKETITLQQLSLQQRKEEVVYQVSQVYILIQTTQKQLEQYHKSLDNINRLIEIGKSQQENGIIRKVDVARLQVNKSNLLTQIDNLTQLYDQQIGWLKVLTGIEESKKIILTDTLSNVNQEDVIFEKPDLNLTTTIKNIDQQKQIANLTLKANKQQYLPTVSGFGQYYLEGQRNSFDFFKGGNDKFFNVGLVGLSLSIPIFDGMEKSNKIRQNEIERKQLDNLRENTLVSLSKEYNDAVKQFVNCKNILARQQKNIQVADETYQINLEGYKQQVTSLSDLMMSESSLIEARLSYYNALMQINNAKLDIQKASGKLLNF